MVHLRVQAGTSLSSLVDIPANHDGWTDVSSPLFEGRITVQIKGYVGPDGHAEQSKYFDRPDRKGKTWSVAFQGRFLEEISADDLMFGNTFDRPISLPWGSSAVLSFMSMVDPTLTHDLQGPRPWALSPAISSFPFLTHQVAPRNEKLPEPPHPSEVITEGRWELPRREENGSGSGNGGNGGGNGNGNGNGNGVAETNLEGSSERRTYFQKAENRKAVTFGPDDVLEGDFCHSFLQFPELYLVLPGGIKFDLKKYWDGQPVRFVCMRRQPPGAPPHDAHVYWVVQLQVVGDINVSDKGVPGDDDDEEDDEDDDDDDSEEEDDDEDGPPGGFSAARPSRNEDVD